MPLRPNALSSFWTALALGASASALLAGAAQAETRDAELTPDSETSDVIVVTATRTGLSNFDYPGMTSALALETLDAQRPGDLAQLLEDVPGLEIGGGPRRTGQTIALRGFGRESVTLLLDGARQNFASAHDGVLFLDPALLGRVETVRGSASALYGSGAAGGVLAFETVEADDLLGEGERFGARLSAGWRSVNEETRGSAALFGEQGAFEGIAAITARESGDIRLGSGDDLPASDSVRSTLLAGEWDATDALEIEAGWVAFRNSAREPNNGQNGALAGRMNPVVDKDVVYDSYRLGVSFDPASAWVDVDATLYRNLGEVNETDPAIGRFIDRDLETLGLRLENRAEFALAGAESALLVGAEWYRDEQTGFDSTGPGGTRGGVPNGSTEFTGAWAQLETVIALGGAGSLIVLPGVRFDRFESESALAAASEDDAVSPRLAASWAPNDALRVFASWSEAFRAPSLNELYLSGTHFSLPHPVLGPRRFITNDFIANPALEPERSETVEIGFGLVETGVFGASDRFEIKAAAFRTQAEDLIDLGVAFAFSPTCFRPPFLPCSAGTSFSTNRADATLEGYELVAGYSSGAFSLDGALYSVDGEDDATGQPLGALQPVSGHVRAGYAFDAQRLTVSGRLGFAGDFDRTADPNAERPGFAVLDLYAGWRPFADRRLRIDAGIENVLDHDYERVFAGVSEPGRTVRIDLTWTGGW